MVLIVTLIRLGIFPNDDISLSQLIKQLYNKTRVQVLNISENWKPKRTIITCFIWREIEPDPVGCFKNQKLYQNLI